MLTCYTTTKPDNVITINAISKDELPNFVKNASTIQKNYIKATDFTAEKGEVCLLPEDDGTLKTVLTAQSDDAFAYASIIGKLPPGTYQFQLEDADKQLNAQIAWGMHLYQFSKYKKSAPVERLCLIDAADQDYIDNLLEGIYLTRDLINTPTEDMGPAQLSEVASNLAAEHQAEFSEIIGEQLLQENYPAVHAVGRASVMAPRLLEIRYGSTDHPKVTLVGKGVCFDSGGLDIKPSQGMRFMKKDMGGSAHVLALAKMIMQAKLPVQLRVLVPAVENAVSGNAFRPGDILTMRNGKTVEVGNTDAEGRLILADALVAACEEDPELLIDFATLTGAARVAVGTELAAMFCNDEKIAEQILTNPHTEYDPIWRLPLFKGYRRLIDSKIADLCNIGSTSLAGATTAGLFLQEFINKDIPWVHFDIMAFNTGPRPAYPEGGEAMGLRTMFDFLQQRYS